MPWTHQAAGSNPAAQTIKIKIYLKSANNLVAAIKTENVGLIYEPAEYLFTLDWPNANRLQHFVKLINNGQFAVVPNHKLLVDSKLLKFPKYKKIRSRWN